MQDGTTDAHRGPGGPLASPLRAALEDVWRDARADGDGDVATYIPELAKVDASLFGIGLVAADGELYEIGDSRTEFTIQSISKPFVYGLALEDHGRDAVLRRVGVEPTGEAFNAIVFDERGNRPFNPMVNSGAIATTALILGDGGEHRLRRVLDLLGRCAGRTLDVDEAVFRSERETGHRNRAIAWLELNFGMIDERIDEHLDLYFQQCSVLVTARDLAVMAATLANGGLNPVTGVRAMAPDIVRDVLSVMNSCGMYDYAGEWSFRIGLPAKSGVGGGILAVLPGQFGIGSFSPRLDERGNSVRGIRACRALSERFDLHVFAAAPSPLSVVRRRYRAEAVRSMRLRSPAERAILERFGAEVAVCELQGDLYFSAMERVFRDLADDVEGVSYLVLDARRVRRIDASARRMLTLIRDSLEELGKRLLLAGLAPALRAALAEAVADPWPADSFYADADAAIEWCEDRLIAAHVPASRRPGSAVPLERMDLFAGFDTTELTALRDVVFEARFEAGETIVREGETADRMFVLASGSATVQLRLGDGGRVKRLQAIGVGVCFGEIALFDGGTRSADVVADVPSVCWVLPIDRLDAIASEHPRLRAKLLFNIGRDLCARLRGASTEIRVLEE